MPVCQQAAATALSHPSNDTATALRCIFGANAIAAASLRGSRHSGLQGGRVVVDRPAPTESLSQRTGSCESPRLVRWSAVLVGRAP